MRLLLLALLAGVVLHGCSPTDPMAGGSSDHGNAAVACVILSPDGTPARGALVRLRPVTFLADTSDSAATVYGRLQVRDTLTDAAGSFAFDSIPAGSYVIEVNDQDSSAAIAAYTTDGNDGRTDLAPVRLEAYARVTGTVLLPESDSFTSAYVLVQGLDRVTPVSPSASSFAFTDLPASVYTLRIVSPVPRYTPTVVYNVQASSGSEASAGDVVVDPYHTWSYRHRLLLNTSATGANLAEDLVRFPLMVRLDNTNFNFSHALPSGDDVRFARADGLPLPYAVDTWDPSNRRAVFWVLMDTLHAASVDQYIAMYTGNGSVTAVSHSPRVFDTTDGYQGVWYMADVSAEATARNAAGVDSGTTAATGIIGDARAFNRPDSVWAQLPAAQLGVNSGHGSAMFWMRTRADFATAEGILLYATTGSGEGYGPDAEWHVGINAQNQLEFFMRDTSVASVKLTAPGLCTDDTWHHVAVTWSRTGQAVLFQDGAQVAVSAHPGFDTTYAAYAAFGRPHTVTAQHPRFYTGVLDHVVLHGSQLSASWIRASFENQREGSLFPVIE
jgi:hypothetical protein